MCPHGREDHFARIYSCKGHREGAKSVFFVCYLLIPRTRLPLGYCTESGGSPSSGAAPHCPTRAPEARRMATATLAAGCRRVALPQGKLGVKFRAGTTGVSVVSDESPMAGVLAAGDRVAVLAGVTNIICPGRSAPGPPCAPPRRRRTLWSSTTGRRASRRRPSPRRPSSRGTRRYRCGGSSRGRARPR